ncbi:MAG: sulfotransferase family 2 domain-containing protein [Anaerolineae bacterium]|nr:sulfotransferase family 2 domain-containing protein [Anaerolineae bacterium]
MHLRLYPPPVYFIHIHKTAGTSFRQFLNLIYRTSRTLEVSETWQLQNLSLAQLKSFDCYLCHFGVSLYSLVDRDDLPCVTILRDPVERLISELYYHQLCVKRSPHQYAQEYLDLMVPLQDADLRTLLATPTLTDMVRDFQTWSLGAETLWNLRPLLKDGTNGDTDELLLGNPLEQIASRREADVTQVIQAAKQRLEGMAVVGVTERFDEFLELVCDLLGIFTATRSLRVNIGPQKTAVAARGYRAQTPPDLVEQVEELTIHDRELHVYATELFEQNYANYRERPHRTYSIAPRLLMPPRRMALASSTWLQSNYPGVLDFPPISWLRSGLRSALFH